MGRKRIRDLMTENEKEIYRYLMGNLMACASDNERKIGNNLIADLIEKVLERQLSENDQIYEPTLQSSKDESKRYWSGGIWGEKLQRGFGLMPEIIIGLLSTLLISGIALLLFIISAILGSSIFSTVLYEEKLAVLMFAMGLIGIINIVVAIISYKQIRKLKIQSEAGKSY